MNQNEIQPITSGVDTPIPNTIDIYQAASR